LSTREDSIEFKNAITFWKKYQNISPDALKSDKTLRFATKYVIILCSEACAAMGREILEAAGQPEPSSNAATYYGLRDLGLIDEPFAKRMAHLAYMRNDLAHQYGEADVEKLSSVMHSELRAVAMFQQQALKWERMYNINTTFSQIIGGKGFVSVLRSLFP
jgi:uncharacterized protein YutE (UPF0331/DUF86 family)